MTIHSTPDGILGRQANVCIIGAGAAGIALACELDRCNVSVLLLEAGSPDGSDRRSRDAYAGEAEPPHPDPVQFRRMGLGGTTRIWGGRCVPFDPIDFERREHVPHSGWPVSYEEIAEFYPRALEYCHAGLFDFSVAGSIDRPAPTIPGLAAMSDVLVDRIERYSLPTDFGREHRQQLARSANIDVVLDARCVRLHRHAGADAIECAEVVTPGGARHRVRADVFVVATGGIETPRLLFESDPHGDGIGNRHDRLGRFYACHVENVFARLVVDRPGRVAFDFERTRDGIYARRKLQFTPDAQRRHRLLNTAFRLHFPDYSDAAHGSAVMSTIFLAKSTLIPEYQAILRHGVASTTTSTRQAHLANALRGMPELAAFGVRWLFRRALARRKLPYTLIANADGSYPLEFNSEQIPLEDSRITLGESVDGDGMRRVRVAWRTSDDDRSAGERAFRCLRESIGTAHGCRIEYDDADLGAAMRGAVPVGGHHIGTARMATSDREGVVDRHCAVFGVDNLYIAGAAVFPTSSHANPTLTIVAISVRLAATLKQRFGAD